MKTLYDRIKPEFLQRINDQEKNLPNLHKATIYRLKNNDNWMMMQVWDADIICTLLGINLQDIRNLFND